MKVEQGFFKRICFLFPFILLAIPCGITMSLVTSTLATRMSHYSISASSIGLFALASTPYMFKFIVAPFFDSLRIPILKNYIGHRHAWVLLINFPLAISLSLLGRVSVSDSNIYKLFITTFVSVLLGASNELASDSLRVESASKEEMSFITSAFSLGFRIGLLIGGGGSLILVSLVPFEKDNSWFFVYCMMSVIIVIFSITSIIILESKARKQGKKEECKQTNNKASLKNIASKLLFSIFDLTKRKQWYYFILILIFYRAGDSAIGYMMSNFLFSIGFSLLEIGFVVKIVGCVTTCCGSLIGGWFAHKFGLKSAMLFFSFFAMLSGFLSIIQYYIGPNLTFLYFVIGVEDIFQGGILACLFTFMSINCSKEIAATQFSLFVSTVTVSKIFFSVLGGYFASFFSWDVFFGISILLSLPGIFCVFKIDETEYNLYKLSDNEHKDTNNENFNSCVQAIGKNKKKQKNKIIVFLKRISCKIGN